VEVYPVAIGRAFRISKEQSKSYALLNAPKMRSPKKAKANAGVTSIMGISARPNRATPVTAKVARQIVYGGKAATNVQRDKAWKLLFGKPAPAKKKSRKGVRASRVVARRPVRRGRPAAAKSLKAVKKTKTVGGISCLAKPPARYRREGLTQRRFYALPQCFHYPVYKKTGKPDVKRIKRAMTYYGRYKRRYSRAVQAQIEFGIAKAAQKAGLVSPKAMEYRNKFGLGNKSGDTMYKARKNPPRKSAGPRPKAGTKAEFAWLKKAYGKKRKSKVSKKPMPPYGTKAYWDEMQRRSKLARKKKAGKPAARKATKKTTKKTVRKTTKRAATKRKTTKKLPKYGTKAYYRAISAIGAAKRKKAAKKTTKRTVRKTTKRAAPKRKTTKKKLPKFGTPAFYKAIGKLGAAARKKAARKR
jgi:hypothetical protein